MTVFSRRSKEAEGELNEVGRRGSRVLRVVTQASRSGAYGGPFDTAINQCRLLARQGADCVIIAGALQGDQPDPARKIAPGVTSLYIRSRYLLGYGPPTMMSIALLRRLLRMVRHADVIFVSFSRELYPISAAALALIMQKRLVLQTHGMLDETPTVLHLIIDHLIIKRVLRSAETILALTQREAGYLRRFSTIRELSIAVVGNPVLSEVQQARSKRALGNDALFLGRLSKRKRVQDFVKAAEIAEERDLAGKYCIVGPDQGELLGVQTAMARIGHRLKYEGALPGEQVVERLARCDVFVLPASKEPWGNVLVAAVALGRPVIIAKSCALADELASAGCALVFEDGDPEALASAVDRVLSDYKLWKQLGAAARDYAADHLDENRMSIRLREIILAERLTGC